MTTPSKKLISNQEIPYIGLGTFRCTDPVELTRTIKDAVKLSYRHFDCAYIYSNEDVIGKALQECWYLKKRRLFHNK
jgi:diketogulonate reductase-like aldo/keto reductase